MKKIAIFTSGGDAPGMNAHIRAAVRAALYHGVECYAVYGGYKGMIEGNIAPLGRSATANIISKGGTILKTSRSKRFLTEEGRQKAAESLRQYGIDGVIACGGDGTLTGAHKFWLEHQIPIVGTPGTIDNDLYGTLYTIGYDTAINTAAEAIDRIRDTADSHGRVFIVEVMGRLAGHIAMDVGIAGGAEFIAVRETVTNLGTLYQRMIKQGRNSRVMIIVGEGDELGGAVEIHDLLKEKYDIESRVAILGYIQRGGSPTVRDRELASHLGVGAVEALLKGKTDIMVGRAYYQITYTPLEDAVSIEKPLRPYLVDLADMLA